MSIAEGLLAAQKAFEAATGRCLREVVLDDETFDLLLEERGRPRIGTAFPGRAFDVDGLTVRRPRV